MRRPLIATAAVAGVLALAGCAATLMPTAASTTTLATASAIDHWTAVARARYTAEIRGAGAYTLLHRVARDPVLRAAMRSGNAASVNAYVNRQFPAVWYHWHVSRLRIWQGARMITDTGVPFCVDGPKMTVKGPGGRTLGTLQVSIQDEIGVVRLMKHISPVDVAIRGTRAGHFRSLVRGAAQAKLPARGRVTIRGRHYQVRSFHQTALGGEPVTVWILGKA
jgi:hypothetical protein